MKVNEALLEAIILGSRATTKTNGGRTGPGTSRQPQARQQQQATTKWYPHVYTPEGASNVQRWITHTYSAAHNTGATGGGGGGNILIGGASGFALSEVQFIDFMRKMTDFPDYKILHLFDTFDRNDSGHITGDELYVIVALYASYACSQTALFLYLHGNDIFDILCGPPGAASPSAVLSFQKFCELGFAVGLSPSDILATLQQEFNITPSDAITRADFIAFYYVMLTALDIKSSTGGS
ncbi:hypothetical protein Pelo_12729 [Pelomyxa schiedti]|nr:hypothetical protein Pelo_12729 [Pelomyxa schiedti]